MADGGRVSKQTGGITETRVLPPEFIEAAQKTFLADLARQAGLPTVTTAETQQPGETAEQFAQRQAQAQQFKLQELVWQNLHQKLQMKQHYKNKQEVWLQVLDLFNHS